MKPVTPAKRNRRTLKAVLGLLCCLPALSCRQESSRTAAPPPLQVRVAHLQDYAWQDRHRSGQPVDMKPEAERQALLDAFSADPADLLILRGLGSEAALQHLHQALSDRGILYPNLCYVPGPTVYAGLGFLSKVPLTATTGLSDQAYRIKDQSFQPLAGAVLINTPAFPRLWIWNSEAPDPESPYERRRNDARLLAAAIKQQLENGDSVLLSLHSREATDSPMFRLLEACGLERLIPGDRNGDSWTFRDPEGVLYRQDQWLFASPELATALPTAEIYDSPDIRRAGCYRHQGLRLP